MLVEALRDLRVGGIHLQRQIRRQHHGVLPLRRIVSTRRRGHYAGSIRLGRILLCAARARRQLVVGVVEVVEKSVVPLGRLGGSGTFASAPDRVVPFAAAKLVFPAESLSFQGAPLWFGTHVLSGLGGAVGLADRVAGDDQRNRLLLIHCHAGKRLPNGLRCQGRGRVAGG